MSKNSQKIEEIFSAIDKIGSMLEQQVDLRQDVAPFMAITFAKIKEIALVSQSNLEVQHEIYQIATNYLPRVINTFCHLPVNYRNVNIIKEDKNARQLLIDDLKILKKQVLEIEKKIYNGIETQIKVNSSLVREKYDNNCGLLAGLEKSVEDEFINKFDFSAYDSSQNYKDITFKKNINEKDMLIKENQAIKDVKEKINRTKNFFSKIISYIDKKIISIPREIMTLVILVITLVLLGTVITEKTETELSKEMYADLKGSLSSIHNIMEVKEMTPSDFSNFVKAKEEELIANTSFRKKRIKITANNLNQNITLTVSNLDKFQCMEIIDQKERYFDKATVYINGFDLPQDNDVSGYVHQPNDNHKLCHLKENNNVSFDFDNNIIFNSKNRHKLEDVKDDSLKIETKMSALQPVDPQVLEMYKKAIEKSEGRSINEREILEIYKKAIKNSVENTLILRDISPK